MTDLAKNILKILDAAKEPISIHQLITELPNYKIYDIKQEVWGLTVDDYAVFDWNWKLSRATPKTTS